MPSSTFTCPSSTSSAVNFKKPPWTCLPAVSLDIPPQTIPKKYGQRKSRVVDVLLQARDDCSNYWTIGSRLNREGDDGLDKKRDSQEETWWVLGAGVLRWQEKGDWQDVLWTVPVDGKFYLWPQEWAAEGKDCDGDQRQEVRLGQWFLNFAAR